MIAASAGNHAQALAYHGNALNIPVTVVMPDDAPIVKQTMCKEYGANVVLKGHNLQEVCKVPFKFVPWYPEVRSYYSSYIVFFSGCKSKRGTPKYAGLGVVNRL